MTNRALLLASCLLAASATAQAMTSKEYSAMGARSWAAMRCSEVAYRADMDDQREPLFVLAIQQGRQFVSALRADKMLSADYLQDLGGGFVTALSRFDVRHSDDFILGVVWHSASVDVTEQVERPNGVLTDPVTWTGRARDLYASWNCKLL